MRRRPTAGVSRSAQRGRNNATAQRSRRTRRYASGFNASRRAWALAVGTALRRPRQRSGRRRPGQYESRPFVEKKPVLVKIDAVPCKSELPAASANLPVPPAKVSVPMNCAAAAGDSHHFGGRRK
jgi:hypothetical protein